MTLETRTDKLIFHLIANANSAQCKNGLLKYIGNLPAKFNSRRFEIKLYVTHDEKSLETAIAEIGNRNPRSFGGVVGGDGSLVVTNTKYFQMYGDEMPITLLPMPGGTILKEHRDLGVISQLAIGPMQVVQSKRFLESRLKILSRTGRLRNLHIEPRNVLKITSVNADGLISTDYAFDFCFGAPAYAIADYAGAKNVTEDPMQNTSLDYSKFRALSTFMGYINRLLIGETPFKKVQAKIKSDGKELFGGESAELSGGFMSTGDTVLPFLKPCYLASNGNGRAYFIASNMPQVSMVKYLPRWTFGFSIADDPHTIEDAAKDVKIEFEKEELIHFGGEFRKAIIIDIEVLKDRVNFIAPKFPYHLEDVAHFMIGRVARYTFIPTYEKMFEVM